MCGGTTSGTGGPRGGALARLAAAALAVGLVAGCAVVGPDGEADFSLAPIMVRAVFVNDHDDWAFFGGKDPVPTPELNYMSDAVGVLDPNRAGTALLLIRAENDARYLQVGTIRWTIRIDLVSPSGKRRRIHESYILNHGGMEEESYRMIGLPLAWFKEGPGIWKIEVRVENFRPVTVRLKVLPEEPADATDDEGDWAVI